MEKGFTIRTFLIILGVIILMVVIALFVRRDKKVEIPEQEIPEQEIQEEIFEETREENQPVDLPQDNELVAKAKNDLSKRINIEYNEISLVEIRETVFSDHTLGTSRPGEVVPQTPTPGHVIVLGYQGRDYRYHANNINLYFIE
jgi:type III secretory pathway component EscV